ncbi:MAG TPA: GDP-mannose 4,6-dehydratase [Thermoanaerobaculia bacterium]|nr:GDP-mannose 4,6-dehydratase [Thermoanaerobaculia bacterium]
MESMGVSAFWRDRPTLVTGATGLVGGWLVRALLEEKASVVALIRDWVPQSILIEDAKSAVFVRGEIQDQALIERILGEYEINTVFHLAAQTVVPIANRNPVSTFDSNIRGTWSVLEACRRSPLVKQVVIASSDKAYGEQATLPYTEEMPLQPRFPYDVSKACSDLIASSYATVFGVNVAITRCGNFYGGGDLNWSRLVPGTIRSLLRNEAPVIRSDGTLRRDYFYVEDGASAYMLLAEKMAGDSSLRGEAFNFSTETPFTVREIVDHTIRTMGGATEPVVLNEASHEIPDQHLNAAKARARLGWSPRFSFDEGLRQTIDWYRAFLNR